MDSGATPHEGRPHLPALKAAVEELLGSPVDVVEALTGGVRRDTYRVVDDLGARFVLRLDRDGASLEKEIAITHLVGERVPVPAIVGADLAGDLLGVPLTLSDYAAGESLEEMLAGAGDDDARQIGVSVGSILASIGSFSFEEPGFLGPSLRPEPFDAPLPDLLVSFGARILGERGARDALGAPLADGYLRLLEEAAPILEAVQADPWLVHSDFNGKNLVLAREFDGSPRVEAVLDWEFAFSGPPLADVGNMLRRQERLPTAFVDGFSAGFQDAGGVLPPGWRSIAAALDALALLDFLDRGARGEHGAMYTDACSLIEEAVVRGELAPAGPA
jgi:aminoglycoside phosphotransferase (APT) family kinase protein